MKKIIIFALWITVFTVSCNSLIFYNFFKSRISVQEAIEEKAKLDRTENPANKFLIKNKLAKKRVEISDVVVKDITDSVNVDYTFCVIVSVQTSKGPIECYIYANDIYQKEDIKSISKLTKGKSKIDVDGDFNRFFTLLDESYTKIEIINAEITIKEE